MKQKDWKTALDDLMRIDHVRNEQNKLLLTDDILLYEIRMRAKTKWYRKRLAQISNNWSK